MRFLSKINKFTFDRTPPIITTSPSEDHTYSAGGNRSGNSSDVNSNGTSSDAAYESGDEV